MAHTEPVRRIGIVGGECTGKSTLAHVLAKRLPACRVDEALRDFVTANGRPPRVEEQAAVMADQARREDVIAASCAPGCVVSDPAPLMTAVYSLLYFGDGSLVPAASDHARGYDLLVWCAPDIPWVADGAQRDGPDFRARAEGIIADLVATELAPRGVRVLRVTGDMEARVTSVGRAWQLGRHHGLT